MIVLPSFTFAQNTYLAQAERLQLHQDPTWQHLIYHQQGKSEVRYAGFFLSPQGQQDAKQELAANITALFQPALPDQSIRCRFPARSQWLIKQLNIDLNVLPQVSCPQLDAWWQKIQPHSATLIYATDFMGNPSSMFGHTLLRIDPEQNQDLNLVSYAVNYAATVMGQSDWSFALKGLTGQYPGEYSILPYYRKVKEYGDFESRDLWEYELDLNPQETQFIVQHLWEMQNVSFPYYFIADNCAYRLLGLIDLVRPDLQLQQQFKHIAIPVETLKAIQQHDLVKDVVYRPALETQLNSQAKAHGQPLAQAAQRLTQKSTEKMAEFLRAYTPVEQAKILEMAYDSLYLQLTSRQIAASNAQPKLRRILSLRSYLEIEKQRELSIQPKADPSQSHHAKNIQVKVGQVQGENFVEISHRQAYHDLMDPQAGFRLGTQLQVLEGTLQYREDQLKLSDFNLLSVNSYSPVTAFKSDISWGFNLAWQQEALGEHGQFSEHEQHGILNLKTQLGYSWLLAEEQHLCYAQLQNQFQAGKALDLGWRTGIGPTAGCQNLWSDHINSLVQVELPFWDDVDQWQLKAKTELQYVLNPNQGLRVGYEYQLQDNKNWDRLSFSFVQYF
ncbi:DUF4105 domain-containing protein [Acinetobacter sp. B51(2017)]|uniref:Lnb N-terminal periplasmic domain-containing protein n=1 Tax=Acinetobacter sp. B51(2017) TaxID=2060938 RepID=UPI002077568A|nr:DUF4105 domain-containing protein [Acinetobacter sp. B51(2017)]